MRNIHHDIQQLIAESRIQEAITTLLKCRLNSDLRPQVIQLSARWSALREGVRLGNLTNEAENVERNKISYALLEIIDKLTEKEAQVLPFSVNTKWILLAALLLVGAFFIYQKLEMASEPIDLTVYVVDNTSQRANILKGSGKVKIVHAVEDIAEITTDGSAHFNNIPAKYRHEPIQLNIVNEDLVPYAAVQPDSAYIIGDRHRLDLVIQPKGWHQIEGRIFDTEQNPIAEARIVFKDLEVKTNANGYFLMAIPKEKQLRDMPISIFKTGFKTLTTMVYPETKEELKVVLEKK